MNKKENKNGSTILGISNKGIPYTSRFVKSKPSYKVSEDGTKIIKTGSYEL
jgi:hypothetical protein